MLVPFTMALFIRMTYITYMGKNPKSTEREYFLIPDDTFQNLPMQTVKKTLVTDYEGHRLWKIMIISLPTHVLFMHFVIKL